MNGSRVFLLFTFGLLPMFGGGFRIRKFDLCLKDSPIKLRGNVSMGRDGQEYFDATCTVPFDLGERYGGVLEAHHSRDGKTFRRVIHLREKYTCKSLNKYLGDIWFGFERVAKIPEGVCPIAAGQYSVSRVKVNYDSPILANAPTGIIRTNSNIIDNITKKSVFCMIIEFDNKPN